MKITATGVCREFLRQGRGTNIFTAVEETDFVLEPGVLTVLTGRSGSGKSTLLNMLAGLLAPTRGRVFMEGDGVQIPDLYQMEDGKLSQLRGRYIGVIPQGQTAIHTLTVLENVLLPCSLYGLRDRDTEERARTLLEQMGIGHLAEVMPSHLSGGETRRVAIARAMIRRPSILLADEPTGDLDDENTEAVLQILQKAAKEGMAVLLVTHEKEARRFADRIFRMDAGKIREMEV